MANTVWDDEFDSGSYIDGKEFKRYTARVREIIHAAETSVSIGDIHRVLGEDARREWTADALDSIKDIKAHGLLPTRYAPQDRPIRGLHTDWNGKFGLTPPKRKEPYFDEILSTRS